jgi:hypothetical protein
MNPPPLKSVDGSVPCQPISFHSSDFSGGMSRLGYANLQSCLKASWCSTREPSKGICNLDLKVFSLSSCKGLRYTGLLFWLSNEKGNNLPNSDPEPTIIFAARRTAKGNQYLILESTKGYICEIVATRHNNTTCSESEKKN